MKVDLSANLIRPRPRSNKGKVFKWLIRIIPLHFRSGACFDLTLRGAIKPVQLIKSKC